MEKRCDGPVDPACPRCLIQEPAKTAGETKPAEARTRKPNVAMITIGAMLATLMQALDMTISNVALPYMGGTFAASYDESTWLLTSYIVAAAIMTPPTGWLTERFGRRRLYLISVFGFTAASVLCGVSQSLGQAVVARTLQGLAGAALVPLSQATLLDTYPPEKHPTAMAIWGMGIMLGPILGPTVGGWLTYNWNWRWVYFINVPLGFLAAGIIGGYVRETKITRVSAFDYTGFITLSIAVASLQVVLDRGEILDWFSSPEIVVTAVVGATSFYLFLVDTFTVPFPFIARSLFLNRNFVFGVLVIFVVAMVLLGTMALFPPLLQNLLDFPIVTVGLLLAPRGIGTMAGMLIVSQIGGKLPPRLLMAFGLLVTAFAMWGMSGFSLDIGPADVFVWGVIQGFGLGFVFPLLVATTFATLPEDKRPEATGVYNLIRNVGSSIGISIMTTLVDRLTQINHQIVGGFAAPFNRPLHQPPFSTFYNTGSAAGLARLNAEITRQAGMLGYIDDFKLMSILCLLAVPLVLLMTSPPARKLAPKGRLLAHHLAHGAALACTPSSPHPEAGQMQTGRRDGQDALPHQNEPDAAGQG